MKTQSQPTHRAARVERGFSLTELMIAIAIVSILAGIGLAAMGSGRQERALRRATATVTGTMQELRAFAVSSGRAVVVSITPGEITSETAATMSWWFSEDNTCGGIDPGVVNTLTFATRGDNRQTRNVVIERAGPLDGDGNLVFCVTSTGRVIDPATLRPLARFGGLAYDGQALIELIPATCTTTACTPSAYVTTVSFGFNGMTELMPAGYRMP